MRKKEKSLEFNPPERLSSWQQILVVMGGRRNKKRTAKKKTEAIGLANIDFLSISRDTSDPKPHRRIHKSLYSSLSAYQQKKNTKKVEPKEEKPRLYNTISAVCTHQFSYFVCLPYLICQLSVGNSIISSVNRLFIYAFIYIYVIYSNSDDGAESTSC